MAISIRSSRAAAASLAADRYERFLAYAAAVLLAVVVVAIARGQAEWARVPVLVWGHLGTILVAMTLTPVMLLGRRGDRRHRRLGTIWVAAMMLTALFSFGIRQSNHGHFSPIHLLSLFTLVQVPLLWLAARRHQVARHRIAVRAMVTGALLLAGVFTLPPGRLLGHWLFG